MWSSEDGGRSLLTVTQERTGCFCFLEANPYQITDSVALISMGQFPLTPLVQLVTDGGIKVVAS